MNATTEIDISKIINILMKRKTVIVSSAFIGFAIMAGISFLIPPTYRSSAILAPSEEFDNESSNSALSSIVSAVGSNSGNKLTRFYAMTQSDEMARKFIIKYNLKPILFEKIWDNENSSWLEEQPTLLEAVDEFKENILSISQDNLTSFVTISIRHYDAIIAEEWVSQYIKFVNSDLASRQKELSTNKIEYLKQQIINSDINSLKTQFSQMLTKELSTLMLVNTNQEYAYQIIDSPIVPEKPVSPNKPIFALIGALIGLLMSSGYILFKSKNA